MFRELVMLLPSMFSHLIKKKMKLNIINHHLANISSWLVRTVLRARTNKLPLKYYIHWDHSNIFFSLFEDAKIDVKMCTFHTIWIWCKKENGIWWILYSQSVEMHEWQQMVDGFTFAINFSFSSLMYTTD